MIFWKTGKRVKNILIDLLPFSCLASEPTLTEHSSHTFTTFPNPSAPEAPLFAEFWIQSLQIASCNFILLNISKGSQYFVNDYPREKIYIFLFNSPRCPDSTGALNCRMLVFQISFFPVCRIYFLVLVGNFVYLFCDVVSQDCLIFVTAGALVVLRI